MLKQFAAIVLAAAVAMAQPQASLAGIPSTARRLLQTALEKDRAGDLAGAISAYQQVLKIVTDDRPTVAIALVKIAACYRRAGLAQAREFYERVLREYPEQSDAVVQAHEALTELSNLRRPMDSLVWKGKKVDIQGSVTPEGRYISFVDWDTGDLALYDSVTDKHHPVVMANNPKSGRWNVFANASSISRDGSKVAYSWFDNSEGRSALWAANLHGDPMPQRLYDDPQIEWMEPRDWSPDSRWIAVFVELKDRSNQLALVSSGEKTLRVLKAGRWPGTARAFFSPDGKYLAYDLPQGITTARDVWVTAVDGTRDYAAVAHRGHDSMMGWSPDGKYLIFATDRTGSMALWGLPMADGKAQGEPELLKPDIGFSESLGVTRSGALFYGTQPGTRGGSIQVASFDLNSGAVTSPRDVSTNLQENNMNPSWSPDGKYLAYVSERGRSGAIPVIVLRAADTGGLVREFAPNLRRGELAGWEPNSRALLAVGTDFTGRNGAFRISIDTGDVSLLFATPIAPTLSMPAWSADGHSLYYWKRVAGADEQVFMCRDLVSGAEREVIRRRFLGQLNISPDGRHLATETIDPAKNERVLLLVSLATGAAREIMRVPAGVPPEDLKNVSKGARVSSSSWVSDSQSFIARLTRVPEGESELWRVHINGGAPQRLPSSLEAHVFAFKIGPDGRHVAYRVKNSGPSIPRQIWKFEHFLPNLDGR
ncbi:MAG: PD40 domain-containing protein [Acidobacteriia bacterium]|nr:PD40 domain-containing protein [Terriglobia bacterium]